MEPSSVPYIPTRTNDIQNFPIVRRSNDAADGTISEVMDVALVPLTMVQTLRQLVNLPGSNDVQSQPMPIGKTNVPRQDFNPSYLDNRHSISNNEYGNFRRLVQQTDQPKASQFGLINLVSQPCTCISDPSDPTTLRRSKPKKTRTRLVQSNILQNGIGWVNVQTNQKKPETT